MYRQLVFEKITYGVLLSVAVFVLINGAFNMNVLTHMPIYVVRALYAIIFASSVYNVSRRDYYLPFLGNAVYPCNSLKPATPKNATLEVTVNDVSPSKNIVFWASERKGKMIVVSTPWEAYDSVSNTGVCVSDEKGRAIFKVREPVAYKVPTGTVLKKHIHYRECVGNGMLGPVKTVYV